MDKTLKTILLAGASAAALLFGSGYAVGYKSAPTEILDSEVKSSGFFGTETTRILSATVTSLRSENQLVVYRYAGEVRVSIEQTALFGLLGGEQELIVPATVIYYLDMKELNEEDVSFDEKSKLVLVKLPPLKLGDIAFQPERARRTNNGILTINADFVRELETRNYGQARRAFAKIAQQPSILGQAKQQAERNVKSYFEIPLRVVGQPDVRVRAFFPD